MEGSRADCSDSLRTLGAVDRADGIERVYRLRRGTTPPTREQFVVAGPAGAAEKRLPSFNRWWDEVEFRQLALVA